MEVITAQNIIYFCTVKTLQENKFLCAYLKQALAATLNT